jgi:hypothetical protein
MAAIIHREFGEVVRQPCGSWSVRRDEFRSGRCATIETLRLPLRAKDGSVSLILGSSGELPVPNNDAPDRPSAIVTIVQQQFFDIGAGVPVGDVLSGAADHPSSGMAVIGKSFELGLRSLALEWMRS